MRRIDVLLPAAARACRGRLRPVLMTSLTTLIGLLQLALKLGPDGEAYPPLARAVMGGLAGSALQTIFLVPAAYLLTHGILHARRVSVIKELPDA